MGLLVRVMKFSRCLAVLISCWTVQTLSGQSINLNHDFWHTDGTVKAIVEDTTNGRIIIAGEFDKVIPNIPFGALVDPQSGAVYSHLPVPNGTVHVAMQDHLGGWYLAGDFTKVGSVNRNKLAYITAGAEVGTWAPEINGSVLSIALNGDTVFIAGSFTMVNGEICGQLAALDATMGDLLDFRGRFGQNTVSPAIKRIEIYDNKLFAGGSFNRVNDGGANGVRLSPLDPEKVFPSSQPNNFVKIVVEDGQGGWIIQGTFTQVGDSLRNGFAHIDASGKVSAWKIVANNSITSMYSVENTLYIGGYFSVINGVNREKIAAFDIPSQSLKPWNPRITEPARTITADEEVVYAAAGGGLTGNFRAKFNLFNVTDPEELLAEFFPTGNVVNSIRDGNGGWYLIGNFYNDVQDIGKIAHIGADGELKEFSFHSFGQVHAAALFGDTLVIGGSFQEINFVERHNLAMVNRHTGELLDWSVHCDGEVRAMEFKNNKIYFTGPFRTIDDVPRRGAAAMSRSSLALSPWNPGAGGNATVLKIIDDKAYIGGEMYYADFVDNGSPLHTQSADHLWSELRPNGSVSAAASDGNGGWYIGGDFTKVGTQARHQLAHIDLNGQLGDFNPGFTNTVSFPMAMAFADGVLYGFGGGPINGMTTGLYAIDVNTNQLVWSAEIGGAVKDIKLVDDKLYLAGGFMNVGSAGRSGLAAVNRFTGALLPWNPGANQFSHAIHVLGDKLYVAGSFTQIGGVARNKLASVDLITGEVGNWNPNILEDVLAMESTGDTLILAGHFTISGMQRRMAAFNHNTGALINSWGPDINSGTVSHLAKIGNELFLGGTFYQVNGQVREGLAKIHVSTSSLMPWNPGKIGNLAVLAPGEETVYVGGQLIRIGGKNRRLAQFDLETGILSDFNPGFDITNIPGGGHVRAIHSYGSRIFIGGTFSQVNGMTANNLVAFNRYTFQVIPFTYGSVNGTVHAINSIGSSIYIGGEFTTVSGQPRERIAAFHGLTGVLKPFTLPCNGIVRHLNTRSIYLLVGGDFTRIGGVPFSRTMAFDAHTARRTTWEPNVNNTVDCFAISEDGIYLGGSFGEVGGTARTAIAKVTKNTGALLPFNPILSGTGVKDVTGIELIGNDAVVFHGNFSAVNGENRNKIASVMPGSSALHSFNIQANAAIKALGQHNGQLAIGGSFSEMNGSARKHVAMLDPITGALGDWQVDVAIFSTVDCLSANDSMIYVGGSFGWMGGRGVGGLTAFNLEDLRISDWNANIVNTVVNDFTFDGGQIYMGLTTTNQFSPMTIGGEVRTRLAAVNANTAALLPWAPVVPAAVNLIEHIESDNGIIYASGHAPAYTYLGSWLSDGTPRAWTPTTNGRIFDLKLRNDGVFIAGSFTNIAGQPKTYLARLDPETALPHPEWNPDPNAIVRCIGNGSDDLYIGGQFGGFGFEPRANVASFDIQTGALLDFAPSIGGVVHDMLIHDNKLYFAGSIVSLNGQPRGRLAAVTLPEGNNDAININANMPILKMSRHNDDFYVSGLFTHLNNFPANRIGKINLSTGVVPAWNHNIDGSVMDLAVHDDVLYFCGFYNTVDGQPRGRLAAINLNNNELTPWNPGCNGYPTGLAVNGSTLYAAGPFDVVSGEVRVGLAAFDLPSGDLSNWSSSVNGASTYSFSFNENLLFMGGEYGFNEGVLALDVTNAEPSSWVPEINDVVWKVLAAGDRLYVGGEFDYVDGPKLGGFAVYDLSGCSENAVCQDITVQLSDQGNYTLQTGDLLFENSAQCIPMSATFSQSSFNCEDAGMLSLSANLFFANGVSTTCNFSLNVITLDDGDDDGDGIVNFCDFCFGNNNSGDTNGNGICDDSEIVGCMNPAATNYNPLATSPGICFMPFQTPLMAADIFSEGPGMVGDPGGNGSGYGPDAITLSGTKLKAWLYPNPIAPQQGPTITMYNPTRTTSLEVRIYDSLGRLVFTSAHNLNTGHNTLRPMPEGMLTEGVYFCTLIIDDVVEALRFVVRR